MALVSGRWGQAACPTNLKRMVETNRETCTRVWDKSAIVPKTRYRGEGMYEGNTCHIHSWRQVEC